MISGNVADKSQQRWCREMGLCSWTESKLNCLHRLASVWNKSWLFTCIVLSSFMFIWTYKPIKHSRMHIHLPQQTIFQIWNIKSCCSSITGLWIMQNVMCLSNHWCWGYNKGIRRHLYDVCCMVVHVFIGDETEIISVASMRSCLALSVCLFVRPLRCTLSCV